MATYTRFYTPQLVARVQKLEEMRMQRAVRYVRNQIIVTIGVKFPPASLAGMPPHLRTGELRRSISTQVFVRDGKIVGRVGTNKRYGKFLELGTNKMGKRPFLLPALHRSRRVVGRILTGR